MGDELRAAAERLLRWAKNHADDPKATSAAKALIHDAGKCAMAVLAERRADDDEPITDQWWRTLAPAWFATLDDEERLCLVVHSNEDEDPDYRALLVWVDDGSWGFWEQGRLTSELVNPHHNTFAKITTRGDVRRLCKALGIDLKEKTQ